MENITRKIKLWWVRLFNPALKPDELINAELWCSNQKCKMFNIKVAIIEEEEPPNIIK